MSPATPIIDSTEVALLIDFDNLYPRSDTTSDELVVTLNSWMSLAIKTVPQVETVRVRLYGGWLEDGVLTRAASDLFSKIPRDYFPLSGDPANGVRLIRGSIDLVSRLVGVPAIQWDHTFRSRRGLPQLRLAEKPRPDGCAAVDSCPIDLVQRISRRSNRQCHVSGCAVINDSAFLVKEQKMVDVLLSCDAIEFARRGVHIIVMSNDLDLLPSVATTASCASASVTLVRGPGAGSDDLYSEALQSMGVDFADLQAA
jgi:hypothetical protein